MSISPISSVATAAIAQTAAPKPVALPATANPAASSNIGPAVSVTLSNVSGADSDHDGDSK